MKRQLLLFGFIIPILVAIDYSCKYPTNSNTTENKMYVYSNTGKTFYLVDYENFRTIREITLSVSDTISIQGMIISTNRDYLFFTANGSFPNPPFGFAVYNINSEILENVFFTEFSAAGAEYFISAEDKSEQGLIYVHFRDFGTYSFDLFKQKMIEFISNEYNFDLDKRIFNSPDGKWTVVKKNWEDTGYTELEFYLTESKLHDLQFVLNRENEDSLRIDDFEFAKDNKLFITFLPGPERGNECNFGSYDLDTKKLYRSSIELPWSLNPYYTEYSPKRNEIYTIGANDSFYIININTYEIEDVISLTGKITGSSQIQIAPDENIAFVACPSSDTIFIVDLENRKVIKTINIISPYNMIIP